MDIKKRRRKSREKIESVFMELIKNKELNRITVSEICKLASCNRSTFYANYLDVYDLADSIRQRLEEYYDSIFSSREETADLLPVLFGHIKENMELYKLYFRLGYDKVYKITDYYRKLAEEQFGSDEKTIDYHIEFFRGGITAIIKLWLDRNCAETPDEIYRILLDEYRSRDNRT